MREKNESLPAAASSWPPCENVADGAARTYPRIWDRQEEREIIGETKMSWLVKQDWTSEPFKVSKRNPNGTSPAWNRSWFFDEYDRNLQVWASTHFHGIKQALGRYIPEIDAATLHRVAEVIGYYPLLNGSQPNTQESMAVDSPQAEKK